MRPATQSFAIKPFVPEANDPLTREHELVSKFIEDGYSKSGEHYWADIDVKALPSGEAVLAGDAEQVRRYVVAAITQIMHWDSETERVRAQADSDMSRSNPHFLPGYQLTWGRRRHAEALIKTLMRRKLPFQEPDLLRILEWCNAMTSVSTYTTPLGAIAKALEQFAASHPLSSELRTSMKQFAEKVRNTHDKDAKRVGTTLEQLSTQGVEAVEEAPSVVLPAPEPAAAGSPQVLDWYKRNIGMLPVDSVAETTVIPLDRFPLRVDSPLRAEHEILTKLIEEIANARNQYGEKLTAFPTGKTFLKSMPKDYGRLLLAAAERHVNTLQPASADFEGWQFSQAAQNVVVMMLMQPFDELPFILDRAGAFDLLLFFSVSPSCRTVNVRAVEKVMETVQKEAALSPLTEGERFVLSRFRASLISGPSLGKPSEDVVQLTKLVKDGAGFYLVPGEAWADAINSDLGQGTAKERQAWTSVFTNALGATGSRPSAKWLKAATAAIKEVGETKYVAKIERWFPLVSKGQTIRKLGRYLGDTRTSSDTINDENATVLRGLLWSIPLLKKRDDLVHAITSVALSAYKKVPGVGPRAVKVGNACIYALSALGTKEAVGQLAMLKVRVKFGTAQKEIEKAFDAAATALGLPRDQIEELGVPSYGLEEVGKRSESFGGYRADLIVTGSTAELQWFDQNGKQLKSVPSKVKTDHKDDLKELQQSLKDIQSMLPAQRDRIDGLFLLQKSWPISEWKQRYYDHPLVGTIARRLIWCVDGTAAFFLNDVPTDLQGQPIEHGKTAEITLWHPVGRSIEEIRGWRARLETLNITQPFKQAYREVYLLTDAERNTRTYSNRFAAHILRQHQFNALCAARGWKNALRLMVDNDYNPPTKNLSIWNLRAEFWIEGIGDNYGVDTNDAGSFLRLATDQVRFYRMGAAENRAHAGGGPYGSAAAGPGDENINEPLPLDQIPELVFSEIMRDVDLFVGVASVGNDPTWQDGGPNGRYLNYWQSYSFGELTNTANTRKQVLERLVPRLKIAKRCSFSDRFLVVKGDKRTYKIHLGSGNIMMEPNDEYLCIVPDSRAKASQSDLYLPFEGDSTLSIILSKALLLADDTRIKDPSIVSQINRGI